MDSSNGCPRHFNSCGESMQSKLESPMPWIGMYIAAASALVTIAMAADVFHGVKYRKWWLPCKYLSMNAFTLTVLAVSMKLPIDLTNQMLRVNEILAGVSSLALMSTVMANLITSLGTMEYNDIILNLATLGTLVITIVVNVSIHISRMLDNVGKDFRNTVTSQIYAEQIICTVFMFILFIMLCSWSLAVPSLTRLVEKVYRGLNEETSTKQVKWGDFTIGGLRAVLRQYWVCVKIGNPQFSIARSEISAFSGVLCLLTAVTLLEAWLRMHFVYNEQVTIAASSYNWSINWILIIQTVGVGLGTIAPMLRWFGAAKLKSSKIRQYWFREIFFWPFTFDYPTIYRLTFRHHSNSRNLALKSFVRIPLVLVLFFFMMCMLVIILVSIPLFLVSAVIVKIILLPFPHDELSEEIESAWIALHKGEGVSTDRVKSICSEVDKLIEIAEKRQPEKLIELLKKSGDFNGVRELADLPISGPDEVLNCWSLSIVILTCIAFQLPNIPRRETNDLLEGVKKGLQFVILIEKSLNVNLEGYISSPQGDGFWSEDFLSGFYIKIRKETYEETWKSLEDLARNLSNEISSSTEKIAIVYISFAIVWYIKENPGKTEADLFERISVMIADLLSACLTNLVPLIILKCTKSAIKEREENIREAAIVFGQTREILEMLQGRKLPGLDPRKAAHLLEWRSFMKRNPNWMEQDIENPEATATIPRSNQE